MKMNMESAINFNLSKMVDITQSFINKLGYSNYNITDWWYCEDEENLVEVLVVVENVLCVVQNIVLDIDIAKPDCYNVTDFIFVDPYKKKDSSDISYCREEDKRFDFGDIGKP